MPKALRHRMGHQTWAAHLTRVITRCSRAPIPLPAESPCIAPGSRIVRGTGGIVGRVWSQVLTFSLAGVFQQALSGFVPSSLKDSEARLSLCLMATNAGRWVTRRNT